MFKTIFLKRILMVSGLMLLIGALWCDGQTAAAKFQIRGRAVDRNGAGVVGATVTAASRAGFRTAAAITDQNGEFILSLESGEYEIKISADGFTESAQTVNLSAGGQDAGEIVLEVAGTNASVTISEPKNYQVAAVMSATKTLTAPRDVPQSISFFTKEQIGDQAMQSLGEAFRYTPGLSVHQGENNRDQLIIRGQNTTADFFVNGVRDDVQYYRDPYNLERLEVLKGPNAMIFGRGGGGGVVKRVTKEAVFKPLRELTLTGGSARNRRVTADIDQPFSERFALRVNGAAENSGSFRQFVGLRRLAVNPTLTWLPDQDTRLTLSYEFARDRRTADRGITSFQNRPAEVPPETFYGNPNDSRVRSNVNLLAASFDRQIGKLNLHNRTAYGDYDRFYQNYVPGAVNAARLVSISAYNNATQRRNLFTQTDLTYLAATGRVRHTLLGGVELGRQRTNNLRRTGYFNNTSTTVTADFDSPLTAAPVTFRQSATDADNHLRTKLAAVYAQDQIELNRYVQITAGARFDYFDLKYHNNRTGEDLRRIDKLVSPRLGVVVKPLTPLSLYGSYSVSYLPSAGDQFSALTDTSQQIKPEKFTNYEVGAKWDIRRTFQLTSALYRLNRTNTRSIDPVNPTAIIQTGSQRTDGFELGLSGSLTPKWNVSGGYAYQNARITHSTAAAAALPGATTFNALAGRQVGQVPHHNFALWNKYQLTSKFSGGFGIIARSRMFAAVDNSVVLPGYARADAAVFYTFNEHWRLQANVENLLNNRYILNADGNNNISPGAPRSLRLGLTARF